MTPEERAKAALSRCHDCDGWDADKLQSYFTKAIRGAVLHEREECAKLVEQHGRRDDIYGAIDPNRQANQEPHMINIALDFSHVFVAGVAYIIGLVIGVWVR